MTDSPGSLQSECHSQDNREEPEDVEGMVRDLIEGGAGVSELLRIPFVLTEIRINTELAAYLGCPDMVDDLIKTALRDFSDEDVCKGTELFANVSSIEEVPEWLREPYLCAEILSADLPRIAEVLVTAPKVQASLLSFVDSPYMNSWLALKISDCLRRAISHSPANLLQFVVNLQEESLRERPDSSFIKRLVRTIEWSPYADLVSCFIGGIRECEAAQAEWWLQNGLLTHMLDMILGKNGENEVCGNTIEARVAGLRFLTAILAKPRFGTLTPFVYEVVSPEVTRVILESIFSSLGTEDGTVFFKEGIKYMMWLMEKLPDIASKAVIPGNEFRQHAVSAAAMEPEDDSDECSEEGITSHNNIHSTEGVQQPIPPPSCLSKTMEDILESGRNGTLYATDMVNILLAPLLDALPRFVELLRESKAPGRVGLTRLITCEFICILTAPRDLEVMKAVVASGAVAAMLELFKECPQNSILHAFVLDLFHTALPIHLDPEGVCSELVGSSGTSTSSSGPACPMGSHGVSVNHNDHSAQEVECVPCGAADSAEEVVGGADVAAGVGQAPPFPEPALLEHFLGECALPRFLLDCAYGDGVVPTQGGAEEDSVVRKAFDAKGYAGMVIKLAKAVEQVSHDRSAAFVMDMPALVTNVPGWRVFVSTLLSDKLDEMITDWRLDVDNEQGACSSSNDAAESARQQERQAAWGTATNVPFSSLAPRPLQGQGNDIQPKDNSADGGNTIGDNSEDDDTSSQRSARYAFCEDSSSRVSRYHAAREAERARTEGVPSEGVTQEDFAAAGFSNFGFDNSNNNDDNNNSNDAMFDCSGAAMFGDDITPEANHPSSSSSSSAPLNDPMFDCSANNNIFGDDITPDNNNTAADPMFTNGAIFGDDITPTEASQHFDTAVVAAGLLSPGEEGPVQPPTSPAFTDMTNVMGGGPNAYASYCSDIKGSLLKEIKELAGSFDSMDGGMEGVLSEISAERDAELAAMEVGEMEVRGVALKGVPAPEQAERQEYASFLFWRLPPSDGDDD